MMMETTGFLSISFIPPENSGFFQKMHRRTDISLGWRFICFT